jgi:hypothetical protein
MKLNLGEAWSVLLKTSPYLAIMVGIYALTGLGAAIYLGLLWLMAKIFGGAGVLIFLIGLGALFGLWRLIQRYVLYMLKAGHIAVITELIHKGSLPENTNQIEYGKQVVTKLFKEISILFVVDQLVSATVKSLNRVVVRVADLIPIPGIESLAKLAGVVVNYAVTYVDEAVLSFNLARKSDNIWEGAKKGVILYAQNWKPILTNAVALTFISIGGFVVFIVIMLIPFGLLSVMTHNETLKAFWLFCALTIGYGLKLSLLNPLCLIATIITYNRAIEGQEPNMEWERKLDQVSETFRELKGKAAAAAS